jgi:CheY-like chemotaxis protein
VEKQIYTVPEAAREFNRTAEEIRQAIREGLLPGTMVHNIGDYTIRVEDLAAWLKAQKSPFVPGGDRKIRILIIDDEINFANIIKLELERDARLTVRYASWGRDGLRIAEEFQPDLCLIDFMLPDTTGEQVLAALRDLQSTKSTRVVVYSAHTREAIASNPDLEERLQKLGADEFMSKSAGLRALLVKVYTLLGLETTTKVVRRPGISKAP